MSFSPQIFLSNMKAKGGPAKPSRFEVILPIPSYINSFVQQSVLEKILNIPNSIFTTVEGAVSRAFGNSTEIDQQGLSSNASISRYLALQCESAELPGKTFVTEDVKIYGPTFKVPYQVQYAETTLTFICTNDFFERKLFERWMTAIMPTDTNNFRYPKGQNSKYMTDITIKQYNEDVTQIFATRLIDAFPISIAAQQLSWGDDNFHRLAIQFAYYRYEPIVDTKVDIGESISGLALGAGSALLRAF